MAITFPFETFCYQIWFLGINALWTTPTMIPVCCVLIYLQIWPRNTSSISWFNQNRLQRLLQLYRYIIYTYLRDNSVFVVFEHPTTSTSSHSAWIKFGLFAPRTDVLQMCSVHVESLTFTRQSGIFAVRRGELEPVGLVYLFRPVRVIALRYFASEKPILWYNRFKC